MDEELPRALVDTNVWISAFINPNGAPARVLDAFRRERFVPVVSRKLLDEIGDVVERPRVRRRLRFSDEEVAAFLALLRLEAVEATPTGELRPCRDPEDDFVLETAIEGKARYAVSRDDDIKRDLDLIHRLRDHGVAVVSVAQFLDVLESSAT